MDVDAWKALRGYTRNCAQPAGGVLLGGGARGAAQIRITMKDGGDARDVGAPPRDARRYYAAALDMSGATDVRAMYGLVLVDK